MVTRSPGRTSSDPLPGFAPTGAGAVLAAFGRVWVASAGGDLVDGVVPGGGPAVVLRVPLGPTALAADAPAGSLLVTSAPTPSTGWLTQLLMGPGGSWSTGWSVPVGEGPTSVAVDPIGHRAYVASPGDRALDVLDDRNGALLTTLTSPHEPLDVLSAGGALLVSWWEGSIWRMDPSTGQVGATAYVPQGVVQIVLDPTGGTLAAVSRSAGVVTVLRAADLLRVGVFNVTGCPLALAWGGSLGPLAVAESCQPALEIGVAPPQANLTLATPDGATVYVGGVPSVPGKGLPLWPQVLVLTSVSTGHLPGIDLVGWTGGPVTVTLGPSWSDLNATSAVFATEVVVLTAGLGTGMAWVWTGMPWPGRGVPPRRREVKGPQP